MAATRVVDDAGATPLMEGVTIKPLAGTPFKFDVFPDTGCYQSLISLDQVTAYDMHLDSGCIKKIKEVDGGHMECSGSVSFQATYEGRKADVLALVTPALQDEILLSWRTLQRMGVIAEDFPHGACVTKAVPKPSAPEKKMNKPESTSKLKPESEHESFGNTVPKERLFGGLMHIVSFIYMACAKSGQTIHAKQTKFTQRNG